MAKMSEQVREVALRVSDRLAVFEGRVAEELQAAPGSLGASSAGIAEFRGTGSSLTGAAVSGIAVSGTAVSGLAVSGSAGAVPLTVLIDRADNGEVQALLTEAARARSEFDAILAAGAGVIAKRSERALGYAGLAQSTGDGTAVDMMQRLTGSTRGEAFRQVKLGGAMGEADAATAAAAGYPTGPGTGPAGAALFETGTGTDPGAEPGADPGAEPGAEPSLPPARPVLPWHEPLTRAVRDGVLRTEAVTIVMRGLGEPNDRVDAETLRAAAVEIVTDAAGVNADELGRRARQLRDEIDPAGVQIRWDQRYENRSWRFSRTREGARTAWVQFDEESAAWVDAIVGSAMRPRRGGPRFVDPDEAARAEKLRTDSRSNDQIVFDLMIDLLKAGSEADRTLAFGSRQPGVRVIVTKDNLPSSTAPASTDTGTTTGTDTGTTTATGNGYFEETGDAVPGSFIDRQICISGITVVTVDQAGTPLDVGREQRCFTTKQRIALAIRDGGCGFLDCDRPPSYTEAHHIDEWVADDGKTDLADGILMCRRCHMLIHNNGWKIIRDGTTYFAVPPPTVDPDQKPIPLRSKSPLDRARRRAAAAKADAQADGPPRPDGPPEADAPAAAESDAHADGPPQPDGPPEADAPAPAAAGVDVADPTFEACVTDILDTEVPAGANGASHVAAAEEPPGGTSNGCSPPSSEPPLERSG
ncbi:DUF222 domain-containing protein [Mycetocola sp. 2940]|uniref:HNH endonuclease signature motif containing protein n=1 Tax=Mycetocola sp. 2940 TaxID=3156452 RepID=UPI00339B7961